MLRRRIVAIAGESRFAIEQVIRSLAPARGRSYLVVFTGVGDFLPSAQLASALPVLAVTPGDMPRPDHVYVVPGGREVVLEAGLFAFVDHPAEPRAPVDRLFRALANEAGRDATAVILAGHGSDGALGTKRIKEAGGLTIAQAPTDAEYPAMPLAAIQTGMVDLVLPATAIAARIAELVDPAEPSDDARRTRDEHADTLRDILTLVRIRTGHDFTYYKRATLYRRVARRMQVCQTPSIGDYHRYLREHPNELVSLVHDFLISVTNFFRDPEAFDALSRLVIPKLFAHREPGEQIRVWVSGCATGEEAYSIGMLLLEHASHLREPPPIQIFATDIDEGALAVARAGRYTDAIAVDVAPGRLARFFVAEGPLYRVTKELRELVLFSPHNLLRDPPFSRLDLVACRNLLIYLDRDAQERALSMFHFGLRPDGYLFLGSSESVEHASAQFASLDAKCRLFTRRSAPTSLGFDQAYPGARWPLGVPPVPHAPNGGRPPGSYGELHHRVVEHYAAPSVLVDEELDVVHVSETAGRFLALPGGEPTRQLLRLVHPALRLELRSAIYRARQVGRGGDTRLVRFDDDGRTRAIELRVREVDKPELGARMLLVIFDERDDDGRSGSEPALAGARAVDPVVHELEDELQRTRDQLRTTVEQYETSVEELKASNEELNAINEELRSASEELETSKEELQSVNEELSTVNLELKSKVDELGRSNGDLQNLMTSTDIAVVFLDRASNLVRFTPRARDLFNVIPTDLGRPFAHLTHKLEVRDLAESAQTVIQTLHPIERELRAQDGSHYLARLLPYHSLDDRIEGVVMTFVDITELAEAEEAVRASDEMLRLAERAASAGIWTIHVASRRIRMSDQCARLHGFDPPAMLGLGDWIHRVEPDGRDRVRAAVDGALASEEGLDLEYRIGHPTDGTRWLWSLGRAPAAGTLAGITIDVTARRRGEAALRASEQRFRATLAAAPVVATRQDAALRYTWGYVLGRELPPGADLDAYLAPPARAELAALKQAALGERSGRGAELDMTIDGERRAFDVRVEPIFEDGAVTGLTLVAFDISASKRAAAVLLESDRRKDEFIATLSHELRNPLNPLRVALDLQKLAPLDVATAERTRGIMDRQVDHLIALVDDLLDLARLTQNKVTLDPVAMDIRAVVDAAIEDTRALYAQAGHTLSVTYRDGHLPIRGDRVRLVQVFVNLLINAAKYTPSRGEIAVEAARVGDAIAVRVRDNGVGIDAESLATVFELYAQCRDARGRARGGLGIGLNLVRRMVELHGGRVFARSAGPDHGSEFEVELPMDLSA